MIALLMPMNGGGSGGESLMGQVTKLVPFADKIVHMTLFYTLTLVNYWENSKNISEKTSRRQNHWIMCFSLFALLTEVLQKLTGYRSFDVKDIVADLCGVGLGVLIGRLFLVENQMDK